MAIKKQFAAGGVVIKKEKDALFVLLIKDSYGHWTWPKGHIEKGETPEDAAIREVGEETGQKNIQIAGELGKQEYSFFLKGEKIFKTVYIFLIKAEGKEKLKRDATEIQSLRWFSADHALKTIGYQGSRDFLTSALTRLKYDISPK